MSLSFLHPTALYALLLVPLLLALPFVGRRASPLVFRFSFFAPLALRAIILVFVILALGGAQLVQPVHNLSVVFVVDHSDSVPQAEQKRAEEFIRASLGAMRPDDRAAVDVFGENALVERLASAEHTLLPVTSLPRTSHTNIASALRLALALLPDGAQQRIVLLSDGLENLGRASDVMDLAIARGVQIDVVPLNSPTGRAEAYLDTLDAPTSVRKGQSFDMVAVVRSTTSGPAVVRLLADGKLVGSRAVPLQLGSNRISFTLNADEVGFHRYSAELQAANDTLPQNNVASAFTIVQGPPRVLVVENTAGDSDNLLAALNAAHIESEKATPSALTGDLTALAQHDAVFLVNVPAKTLPDAAMNLLPSYVRELGRGLVMIGGADAYGAGGYLRTPIEKALPVDMDVRSRKDEPNLALVFVLDKSGSMGRCHCDNPNGQDMRVESGLPKIDIAKDAVLQATRAMGRADYIGVVAFDSDALWALRVQPFKDVEAVLQKIGGLRAEGQTNIYAGLSEAEAALAQTSARIKHVILLTDGWSRAGSYDELTRKMKDEGITLSVVAAGNGSADYLRELAARGSGRYYAAKSMGDVPQLFFKETIEVAGQYIVEEPFYPLPASTTPILRGLDVTHLPALRGYNGTTPKLSAQVALVSARGDPILATWQYGLGRALAWTSDTKGQWATDWVQWDGFNTFIAQLTNWVLPQANDDGLQVTFSADGELSASTIDVVSRDAAGHPRDGLRTQATLIGADASAETQTVMLNQVGPGRYRGAWSATSPGAYLVQLTQQDANNTPIASTTTGFVVSYSPEYKFLDQNASVLSSLAHATGGEILSDPAEAFTPLAKPATHAEPIWPVLLFIAALLFPLDVAARRLKGFQISDFASAFQIAELFSTQGVQQPKPRALPSLFTARERSRSRMVRRSDSRIVKSSDSQPKTQPTPSNAGRTADEPTNRPIDQPTTRLSDQPTNMTERLKQAKARARQSRKG